MTTATLIPAPSLREQRKEKLRWLAEQVADKTACTWPDGVVTDYLRILAHPSLQGAALGAAFKHLTDAVRLEMAAKDGLVTWQELSDEMAPDGRHYDAGDLAREYADAELSVLLDGIRGGLTR